MIDLFKTDSFVLKHIAKSVANKLLLVRINRFNGFLNQFILLKHIFLNMFFKNSFN